MVHVHVPSLNAVSYRVRSLRMKPRPCILHECIHAFYPPQRVTAMATPQPPLSPVEAFTQLQAKMFSDIPAGSVPLLAERCQAKRLIPTNVCDRVLEVHNNDKQNRVARFVQAIIKMVRVYKSKEMIKDFAKAVRAAASANQYIQKLADEIGNHMYILLIY